MELTNRLKRRFIKDCSLPIALTDEPYFSYFIDLYDKAFSTKKKLESFKKIVDRFETEGEVLDYLQFITDGIFNSIKEKSVYQDYLKADMKDFVVKSNYPSSSIFKECHTGKKLISIDLSKANFQAMNFFDKRILDADSYEEFIRKYTDEEYIINSKYIRQVIFGNLNSKRLGTIEKYMIYQIVEELEPLGYKILLVTDDEIVLEGDEDIYNNIVNIVSNMPIKVAIELFVLKTLRNENGQPFKSDKFYVKEFISYTDKKNLDFEIKATDSTFYAQFFKLLTNQKINENDLVFVNNEFVAKYKEPIHGEIY